MAALIKARNSSRFFQDTAAVLRLGVDQFSNLPLTNQRRGVRSCGCIRKQHLHITRAHVFASSFISTANITGDTAHNIHCVRVIEPSRCQTFRVIYLQSNFGKIARWTRCSTSKDHVIHTATAHGFGTVFTHDPAQRFEQIGFPTAIRTHNTGQTIRNDQISRVYKALKARQLQFGKAQLLPLL